MCYELSFRDLSMDSDTINTVKHKQLFQDSYDTMLLTVITVRPNERPFNTCSKRMKRNANETEGGGGGFALASSPSQHPSHSSGPRAGASSDKQAVCPSRSASQREREGAVRTPRQMCRSCGSACDWSGAAAVPRQGALSTLLHPRRRP